MSYYERLKRHVERSMKRYPDSTVVMDSDTFKIVATGKDIPTLKRRLKKAHQTPKKPVVFQRIKDDAVWILTCDSRISRAR